MTSAISSSLSGLGSAIAQFEKAAATIANTGTAGTAVANTGISDDNEDTAPVKRESTGRPTDRGQIFGDSGGGGFAGALVEAKLAEASYKASIAVLRVADSLTEELLDITA